MKVRKLNIVKDIPESELSNYERLGYFRMNKDGKITKPTDDESKKSLQGKISTLEKDLAAEQDKVKKLEVEIEDRDNDIAEMQKEIDRLNGKPDESLGDLFKE